MDPSDPSSRAVIMTREHIFPSSWQTKMATTIFKGKEPPGIRRYVKYRNDFTIKDSRPEPLFELIVKSVCDFCNNGWMNDLDCRVEPWLLDPYGTKCDSDVLRRWAIKVAVLRSHYESPTIPVPKDFVDIHNGRDIADWHIFIGRTLYPGHSHTFGGVGMIGPVGGMAVGLTQVSWSLGHVAVVAIRVITNSDIVADNGIGSNFFLMFKNSNRSEGILVAEVEPTAKQIPDLALLPKLTPVKWESLVWYFSTNPLSPIAKWVAEAVCGFLDTLDEQGIPYVEL